MNAHQRPVTRVVLAGLLALFAGEVRGMREDLGHIVRRLEQRQNERAARSPGGRSDRGAGGKR